MSERIKELEKQCFEYHADGQVNGFNVGKFAELIVRECADYVQHFYGDFAAKSIGAGMRKHFGVE